jgi:site-specific recombinase XerD
MFERLLKRPQALARQRAGPLLGERLRYLSYRADQGATRNTLQEVARFLLVVAELLRLAGRPGEVISWDEIDQQALLWSRRGARNKRRGSPRARETFRKHAAHWLRFLGRLQPHRQPPRPDAELVAAYGDYLGREKELAPPNIYNHSLSIRAFLDQLRSAGISLREVTLPRIDDTFLALITAKGYKRASVQRHAGNLRSFFRYAEQSGLCRAGLAVGIRTPRVFTQASLPAGPTWEEVQQMFALIGAGRPADIRDRALLLLLAVYGLRSGEIIRLRLDDFDWDREVFTVTRPKSLRSQPFPLSPAVAAALIRYLKEVRPRTPRRELFLTRGAPLRPINKTTVFLIVSRRLRVVCPALPHHGPHALRHACATHLLNRGLSLKEIGDYLGHRHPDTTRIYTKVDLRGLRQVADFDLGGLL